MSLGVAAAKFASWTDKIPGGLSDGKTPSDFSKKLLAQGKKVESEHTSDPSIATEIAMDHLTEDGRYYEKLKRLEKDAATVEALEAGAKRLGVRTPKPGSALDGISAAFTIPRRTQYETAAALRGEDPAQGSKDLAFFKKHEGNIYMQKGNVAENIVEAPASGKVVPPPAIGRFVKSTKMSPSGHRAANAAFALHEGFERRVKPQNVAPIATHLSPEVLINEHNMVQRMTGPGSREAKSFLTKMRELPGVVDGKAESAALRDGFVARYGPRAEQYLAAGNKVPAAMRRNYVRGEANDMRQSQIEDSLDSREHFQRLMQTPKAKLSPMRRFSASKAPQRLEKEDRILSRLGVTPLPWG